MQTEHLKVTGMTCGSCVNAVTRAIKAVTGVTDVDVLLADGKTTVQYDEARVSPDQLKAAVVEAGFGVDISLVANSRQSKGGCCS